MPDPLSQSILCPILIGRDAQVAALTLLLEQARSRQGQIVLINGEAGIGKSRLVADLLASARDSGVPRSGYPGDRRSLFLARRCVADVALT